MTAPPPTTATAGDRARMATFEADGLLLGVDVARVQEVLGGGDVTPVPLAPPAVLGLLNLRGRILTVVDARQRLGLAPRPVGDNDDALVQVVLGSGGEAVSLVVDRAGDVVDVDLRSREPVPVTLDATIRTFVTAVHQLADALLLVLDVDRALAVGGSKWEVTGAGTGH